MDTINAYLDLLFNDAAFAIIIVVIGVGFYFFLTTQFSVGNRLFFITMTNHHLQLPREATIVILNRGKADILASEIQPC